MASASLSYIPQKCGIRFKPPAIVLTYEVKSTGKVHCRIMPLRKFTKNSGITRVAEELKNNPRHKDYLDRVPLHQLERLVTIIQDHLKGSSLEDTIKKTKELDHIDPNEDLNKVDPHVLQKKKAIMDETFENNRKRIGDEDFVYDKEVDFEQGAKIETCEWDSEDEEEF